MYPPRINTQLGHYSRKDLSRNVQMQSHRTPSHIYTVKTQHDIYGTHAAKATQSHTLLPQATPQQQYVPLHFHSSEKDLMSSLTGISSSEKDGYNLRSNPRTYYHSKQKLTRPESHY